MPHQAATVSRLIPHHHTNRHHEHQFDSHAQRSQASQDVLQSFRNAFLRPRQEDLRRLRSGRGAAQKGSIIACSTIFLSAGTLSLLGLLVIPCVHCLSAGQLFTFLHLPESRSCLSSSMKFSYNFAIAVLALAGVEALSIPSRNSVVSRPVDSKFEKAIRANVVYRTQSPRPTPPH